MPYLCSENLIKYSVGRNTTVRVDTPSKQLLPSDQLVIIQASVETALPTSKTQTNKISYQLTDISCIQSNIKTRHQN